MKPIDPNLAKQAIAKNKLRKLLRTWDYWWPLRQFDPLRGKTAQQAEADRQCGLLAEKIFRLKRGLL